MVGEKGRLDIAAEGRRLSVSRDDVGGDAEVRW